MYLHKEGSSYVAGNKTTASILRGPYIVRYQVCQEFPGLVSKTAVNAVTSIIVLHTRKRPHALL